MLNRPSQACGKIAASRPISLGHAEGDGGAGPGDAARPRHLTGADIDSDHGDEAGAEPEQQRDLQIVQTRGDAVTRDRVGAEAADRRGDERHREVALDRTDRGQQADPQNIAEQAAAQWRDGQLDRALPERMKTSNIRTASR